MIKIILTKNLLIDKKPYLSYLTPLILACKYLH